MGFVKGKAKKFRVTFRIKAKKKTGPDRRKELKSFFGAVRKLARQFNGTAKRRP